LLADEAGQGTVEYILILSVCIVAATQLARAILSVMDNGIARLGAVLEKDLKTGRQSLATWEN
jgi:hypothetical protein